MATRLLWEAIRPRRGIRPSYSILHVFQALMALYKRGPLGRRRLARLLGLGETSVRTLMRRLEELGLASRDATQGFYLTRRGFRLAERLAARIPRIVDATGVLGPDLLLDRCAYAALVRGGLGGGDWMRLRDVFVRMGGTAALILVSRAGMLLVPPLWRGEEEYPSLAGLRRLLEPGEGDYVVVVYAGGPCEAEEALVAGLLSLLE